MNMGCLSLYLCCCQFFSLTMFFLTVYMFFFFLIEFITKYFIFDDIVNEKWDCFLNFLFQLLIVNIRNAIDFFLRRVYILKLCSILYSISFFFFLVEFSGFSTHKIMSSLTKIILLPLLFWMPLFSFYCFGQDFQHDIEWKW